MVEQRQQAEAAGAAELTAVFPRGFDGEGFVAELLAARDATANASEDAVHLMRVSWFEAGCRAVGLALLFSAAAGLPSACTSGSTWVALLGWATVALFGVVLTSLARTVRWTVIAHHVSHGGYDKCAGLAALPSHFRRGAFAMGLYRRLSDWLDWMEPSAWNMEHNKLHHYHLSEDQDPDLVERNFQRLRDLSISTQLKLALTLVNVVVWRWYYYAPNTMKELLQAESKTWTWLKFPSEADLPPREALLLGDIAVLTCTAVARRRTRLLAFWVYFLARLGLSMAPMALSLALPSLVFLFLGLPAAAGFALLLSGMAETLTNIHTFIIIVCNHAGPDLYRFSSPCRPHTAEFYLRAILASSNFECGQEWIDLLYGWLNYQIEHHMFPDLAAAHYRRLQPLVKAICAKHSVPYVQENAFRRTYHTLSICCGTATMKSAYGALPTRSAGAVPK